jgi:hypothetical protein
LKNFITAGSSQTDPIDETIASAFPRRVVDEIVVAVGAHERDQVSGRLEGVEVFVLAQERLPLVAGVAPAGRPHGVAVTIGQTQANRHEVSSHAAHNSDGRSGGRTE